MLTRGRVCQDGVLGGYYIISNVRKPAAGGVGMGAQKSMKDLEKEKAQASIWGGAGQKPASGFGAFGGAPASSAAPPSSSGNGLDDLLF